MVRDQIRDLSDHGEGYEPTLCGTEHPIDPNLPEDEVRAKAREFVDFYTQPGKPAVLSGAGARGLPPAFTDEVYRYSRRRYMEIN